ncbi:MAG: Na/Pi cotransporter family protein [Nitrospinota bacterium]|nr:MAG: Na/Pi cotransporter family protein [Nitrospinota bacterium]
MERVTGRDGFPSYMESRGIQPDAKGAIMTEGIPWDLETLRNEVLSMCQQTLEVLKLVWQGFRRQDMESLQQAKQLCQEIHQREKVLTEKVVKELSDQSGFLAEEQELFFAPLHLERIGDNVELLIRALESVLAEGILFSERAIGEINTLFEKATELLECIHDVLVTKNRVLIRHILEEGRHYEELVNEYASVHQQRLIEGVCMPKASSIYLAILDDLRGIEWHTRQIAQELAAGGR